MQHNQARQTPIEEYRADSEPFYLPIANEVESFEAAYLNHIPVLLKGPTGCGKTRFVEYMSWRLGNQNSGVALPLVTINCHEDLTAGDLVGRFLLNNSNTEWVDGPLTRAVKHGGICYLDEVVEARKDTIVVIHSLTDYRRFLPIDKLGLIIDADDQFLLVVSYNPGYQSTLKDLKHSTRQRFAAIEFGYPPPETEAAIIAHEAGVSNGVAESLAHLGAKLRNLDSLEMLEGPNTRLLIYAGKLMRHGMPFRGAVEMAVTQAVTDDHQLQNGIREVAEAIFSD
ncbi:MAG: CbbQ/NirQ/NorQ/GpvN family protein [Actinomycetota bacterium]|nr:MAG: CbbQ/NirQ/NorQ/GpvN family protein [Actinomycetota bacterium]